MRFMRCLAGVSLSLLVSSPGWAMPQTAPAPLDVYGALPAVERVTVSPDGRRVAMVSVADEARTIAVLDAFSDGVSAIDSGAAKIRGLDWLGDDRLVVTTSTTERITDRGLPRTEFYSGQVYDPSTGRVVRMLSNYAEVFPALMGAPMVRATDAGPALLVRGFAFDGHDRFDLFRVNPANGVARLHARLPVHTEDYVVDAGGRVVARSEYDEIRRVWSLYLGQAGDAGPAWTSNDPVDLPRLAGLTADGSGVIVVADRPELETDPATSGLYTVSLADGSWREMPVSGSARSLIFHPADGHYLGARVMRPTGPDYVFADPAARRVWRTLRAVFPEGGLELVSWSDDLQTVAVETSGAGDAGTYHLIDLAQGRAEVLGRAYPDLPADQIAPVRRLEYAATDGLTIHAYLTLPSGQASGRGLPLVVLPHGGPEAHDEGGFDWWAQALASRGYAVVQPNFRGSTGYGRAFVEAGYGEWGAKMQSDLSDAVDHLAETGVIDPARVCIVGASYGGYAALAGVTVETGHYRCAVAVSAVSDLRTMVLDGAGVGRTRENAAVRYWNRFIGAARLGDRSIDQRSPLRRAEGADAPVLLIHGRDDTVVPIQQSRSMYQALRRAGKTAELIELDGEDHWLSRAETRQRMLAATVTFLERHNPPR